MALWVLLSITKNLVGVNELYIAGPPMQYMSIYLKLMCYIISCHINSVDHQVTQPQVTQHYTIITACPKNVFKK